jgi:hypothetical protein
MANPFIHAAVLIAAIIIPGGLIVYLAWAADKVRKVKSQKPTPEDARAAFEAMYPPESLRGKSRRNQLARARAVGPRKPKN